MVDIHILTERKGSNPGGKCTLSHLGRPFQGYIKYCSQSRLPPDHPFTPINQPIYEAITLKLAEEFGLYVPRHFIIDNTDSSVALIHDLSIPKRRWLSNTSETYFLSKLTELPREEDQELLREILSKEKIYRDLLMIGDISGKKQNFILMMEPQPHILYVDLGCSFADAVENHLQQRSEISNLTRDKRGNQKPTLKKDIKRAEDLLIRIHLVTNHLLDYQQNLVCLLELIESVPSLSIPIFPTSNIPVKDLLSKAEIEEIKVLLKLNMSTKIRDYTKAGKSLELIVRG